MKLSRRKLCEFVLRDYALKKLGWKDYFELSKFPIKEAFKDPIVAIAMMQLNLAEPQDFEGKKFKTSDVVLEANIEGNLVEIQFSDIIESISCDTDKDLKRYTNYKNAMASYNDMKNRLINSIKNYTKSGYNTTVGFDIYSGFVNKMDPKIQLLLNDDEADIDEFFDTANKWYNEASSKMQIFLFK